MARSSVYTALGTLAHKGLVGTTHEAGVKRFVIEGHGALMDFVEAEERRAKERVSSAKSLADAFRRADSESDVNLPHVAHFEGQEGLQRVYLTMLRHAPRGSVMSVLRDDFLWTPAWAFVRSPRWRQRVRTIRAERGIETRLLINASAAERRRRQFYLERPHLQHRVLPKGHEVSGFALYVLGPVAAILSTRENNLVGIQIADEHLAMNQQVLFDLLWSTAKPFRAPRKSKAAQT